MEETQIEKVIAQDGVLDRVLEKVISRKLLVWTVATVFMGLQFITGAEWIQICLLYIGIQGLADMVIEYRRAM